MESVPPSVRLVIAEGEEQERKAVGLGDPREALQLVQGLIGVGLSFRVTVFGLLPELLIACEKVTELVLFHCLIYKCMGADRVRSYRMLPLHRERKGKQHQRYILYLHRERELLGRVGSVRVLGKDSNYAVATGFLHPRATMSGLVERLAHYIKLSLQSIFLFITNEPQRLRNNGTSGLL